MTKHMSMDEWRITYNALMDRDKAYRQRIDARLRVMARKAGIDSGDCMYIHLHNCQVRSLNGERRFWSNVDYTIIHQMQTLYEKSWGMYRLIDKWSTRVWREISA